MQHTQPRKQSSKRHLVTALRSNSSQRSEDLARSGDRPLRIHAAADLAAAHHASEAHLAGHRQRPV